jgi:selenocysteine-specific elongation factor
VLSRSTDDEPAAAVVRLTATVPIKAGDRFVLREVGRRAVVAGGVVLDPGPPRKGARLRAAVPVLRAGDPTPRGRAEALLEVRGRAAVSTLRAHSGGGAPPDDLVVGDVAVSPREVAELSARALAEVEVFHRGNPWRPGIPRASLATRLGIEPPLLEFLMARCDDLVDEGAAVRAASFAGGLDEAAQEAWERARGILDEAGLSVPGRQDLGLHPELVHALLRAGELVEVSEDLVYPAARLEELEERVRAFGEPFTVAQFRDTMGITRKHAVPLLEWLDRTGITRRSGDLREVRR